MARLRKASTLSMHVTKHKTGARGLQRHNERKQGQKHSNKNIDDSRTADNVWLTPDDGRTYAERIDKILEENYTGKRAVRKDAVKMCEITVQLGGDLAENGTEAEQIEALKESFEELKDRYGASNVVSAVIHVDETTPHLHFDFVPLTKEGKLSAKQVIGDRKQLRETQRDFLGAMQKRCPEFRFDRKENGQYNGLEQKLFEKMTADVKQREEDLLNKDDELEDKEIELEEKAEVLGAREAKLAEQATEIRGREEAIADTASKLADKTRELNLRAEDLQTREEALRASESLLEARKARELAEARKEAEKLREEARAEAKAITERAEEEAKGILSRAKAKASEMMEQAKDVLRKIPLVNKMMIGWAERQDPDDRQTTEDVIDAMTQYGVTEPVKAVVESEDDKAQRQGMDLLQAMAMLQEDNLDEAKETAETKGELSREDVHDILTSLQDLHDDGWQL